jgi:hypothetical protein
VNKREHPARDAQARKPIKAKQWGGRLLARWRQQNEGTLELAQEIANHASPRTTKLYDRRGDKITQDAIERIRIE